MDVVSYPMRESIAAVCNFAISYLDGQFRLYFLHRIIYFSMKAEPQFLAGIFLMASLNSVYHISLYDEESARILDSLDFDGSK